MVRVSARHCPNTLLSRSTVEWPWPFYLSRFHLSTTISPHLGRHLQLQSPGIRNNLLNRNNALRSSGFSVCTLFRQITAPPVVPLDTRAWWSKPKKHVLPTAIGPQLVHSASSRSCHWRGGKLSNLNHYVLRNATAENHEKPNFPARSLMSTEQRMDVCSIGNSALFLTLLVHFQASSLLCGNEGFLIRFTSTNQHS